MTLFLLMLFFPLASFSQTASFQYAPMENIPGFESQSTGNFFVYVQAVYNFGLWAVGIAALLMISIGGFMYITSAGNNSSMEKAKGVISDAIIGLVLALVAYLLLYVINPDLVRIKPLPQIGKAVPPPVAAVTPPLTDDLKELASIASGKITFVSSGECKDSSSSSVSPQSNISQVKNGTAMTACNCTCKKNATACSASVNPSKKMLQTMIAVADQYGSKYSVNSISGGEHGCTSLHYQGRAIDILSTDQKLIDLFMSNGATKAFCDNAGDPVPCSRATHIHVSF